MLSGLPVLINKIVYAYFHSAVGSISSMKVCGDTRVQAHNPSIAACKSQIINLKLFQLHLGGLAFLYQ